MIKGQMQIGRANSGKLGIGHAIKHVDLIIIIMNLAQHDKGRL